MTTMTRQEMENALVEAGVKKWGEEERGGVVRLVRAKSLATVRLEYALLIGDKVTADAVSKASESYNVARHCNEDGHS